ncbi:MAG: Rrf2 family transcriptional regulator [Candidatus Goldbacteria bacterium]|nr:Rrf2 family transcriptional regulator [Candidatus Goldiibacteriota bacterium]
MKLSTRTRYGTRLLFELAYNYGKGPQLLNVIAEKQDISEKYLSKIVLQLKSAGIINSQRGAKGGYELAKEPSKINMLQVMNSLEGDTGVVECVKDAGLCDKSRRCPARGFWCKLESQMVKTLESTTLEDIVNDYKVLNKENEGTYCI